MNKSLTAVICGLALVVAAGAQAATLDGLTLSAEYRFPTLDAAYQSATATGPFTVGPGEDAVIDVEGVTRLHFDFEGNQLTVRLDTELSSPTWTDTAFNGVRIELETPGAGVFTGFEVVTSTLNGVVTPSFDADALMFDWGGASYVDGSAVVFSFGFDPAPVPLPATLPLMGAGLAGLACLRRRAKQRAV